MTCVEDHLLRGAVQLDDQSCLFAVEVCDKLADGLLPLEARCVASQEVVPEVAFLGRGVLAEGLSKEDEVLVVG